MSLPLKQPPPLPPTLRLVSPSSATLGSGDTVFQLSGTSFNPAARVRVHGFGSEGSKLDKTFSPSSASSEKLQITVPASFFELQGGELGFSVENPAPPRGSPPPQVSNVSNEIVIPVYPPTILEINPSSVAADQPATVTITASHLLDAPDGSRRTDVLVDGVLLDRADSTVNLSKNQVVAQLSGALLAAGTHAIALVNAIPNPPGGVSNTVYLQSS